MIKIDLFCESGEKYGLGHLKRCENLLLLFKQCYPSLAFKTTFHALPCPIPQESLEIVIIDSYITSLGFYQALAKKAKILLCLDDFSRLPYPSNALILSPTHTLKNHRKNFFSGKDYVILHPIFKTPTPLKSLQKNHILITLGGSNQNPLITEILSSLSSLPDLFFHILSPSFQTKSPNIQTYPLLSPTQVCSLIDSCEYIITASGGSLNEALSRKKKIIALCIAKNQKNQLQAYQHSKSLFPIFNPHQSLKSKLLLAFETIKNLPAPSFSYGSKLPKLFKMLLLQAITPPYSKAFDFLHLNEKKQILKLRNQKEVREASFNPAIIKLSKHLAFIASLQNEDFYFAFFKQEKNQKSIKGVGYIHLKNASLGIYRDKDSLGFGKTILEGIFSLALKLDLPTLSLKVLKQNQHAINFYRKHDFQIIKEEKQYFLMQKHLRKPR